MLIVGLTGGIACGKSTVSKELTKYNLTIIDADLIAKEVVLPNTKTYQKIINEFNNDIPNLINQEDKSLNRVELGKFVFQDKTKLKKLNSIVHPAVKWSIIKKILIAYFSFQKLVILDVPLLFESGLYLICGSIINVSCEREIQIERLLQRNPELNEIDAINRINNQMSNDEKNYKCDYILNNSGSIKDLQDSIKLVLKEIKPNLFWYLIDLIPPFGILSAIFTFIIRRIIDKYKGDKPKVN